ncbi:Hypothetical protein J6896_05203 [Nakaseomyces glabratus]
MATDGDNSKIIEIPSTKKKKRSIWKDNIYIGKQLDIQKYYLSLVHITFEFSISPFIYSDQINSKTSKKNYQLIFVIKLQLDHSYFN